MSDALRYSCLREAEQGESQGGATGGSWSPHLAKARLRATGSSVSAGVGGPGGRRVVVARVPRSLGPEPTCVEIL